MVLFQKKNYKIYFILLFFVALLIQAPLTTKFKTSIAKNSRDSPQLSAPISGTMQWLNNTEFDNSEDWYNESNTDISNPDVNSIIENGLANYEILGEIHTYSNINGTPTSAKGWTKSINFQYPSEPNQLATLTPYGGYARHYWSDISAYQQVAVQWEKEILMPYNMSDYVVTAASLNMTVNGTVHSNPPYSSTDTWGGLEVSESEAQSSPYFNVGDFVRYYIILSDQNKNKNYTDVISYQPQGLGADHGSGNQYDYLYDTVVEVDDENDLIFILNNLFQYYNPENITITIGIFLYCEDNYLEDDDFFEGMFINSVNFSFTYEKNIDEGVYISWNQDGNNVNSLSSDPVQANSAKLRFQFKINKNWSVSTPKENSELKCYLNGNPYIIPIKLIDISDTVYNETEIYLTPPAPNEGVNLSIEVVMNDEFELNQTITISIDNVTLDISYTIFRTDVVVSSGGGGGGGTKIIRGEDYSWLVYTLTAGIIGLAIGVTVYEKHYKYPPMIRKIRKLKKKVRKGRKVKSLLVNSREQLISDSFKAKTHQVLEVDAIQPEVIDKLQKGGS